MRYKCFWHRCSYAHFWLRYCSGLFPGHCFTRVARLLLHVFADFPESIPTGVRELNPSIVGGEIFLVVSCSLPLASPHFRIEDVSCPFV